MKNQVLLIVFFLSQIISILNANGQCNKCPTVIGTDEFSITDIANLPASPSGLIVLGGDVCLNGTLVINDVDADFNLATVFMGKNAKIIVPPPFTLRILNSTLVSCDQINMWDKIEVLKGGTLKIQNSTIQDAKIAVDYSGPLHTGGGNYIGPIVLSQVTFNKNWESIYLHDFWNYIIWSSCSFDKITIQSLSTNGLPTTSLLAPHNSASRSYIGVDCDQPTQILFPMVWSSLFLFNMINLEIGLKANGRLWLYNSNFDGCGKGVYSTGSISEMRYCNFLNCVYGIVGLGGYASIYDNIFTNFSETAILYRLGSNFLLIQNNQFNCSNNLPMQYGSTANAKSAIFILSPLLNGMFNSINVNKNYIANCKDAIIFNSIRLNHVNTIINTNYPIPAISNNYVWLQTPFNLLAGNQYSAIKVINCRNIGTGQNYISRLFSPETAQGLEENNLRGIHYQFSTQTFWGNHSDNTRYIWKNNIENTNNSIFFSGSCLGVGVQCNDLWDPYFGVTIGGRVNVAEISTQLPYPLPYPSLSITGNNWYDNNCLDRHHRVYGNNAQSVYWNHISFAGGTGFPDVSNCTNVTPNYTGPLTPDPCHPIDPQSPEATSYELRENNIGSIVRNSTTYNIDDSLFFKQYATEFAYESISLNPEWVNTTIDDDFYVNFYYNLDNSNLGKFRKFDSIFSQGYDTLTQKLILSNQDLQKASNILSTISPLNQYDTDKKYLYKYFLDNALYENIEPVVDSMVSVIAHTHPLDRGNVVFIARAFMQIDIDDSDYNTLRKGKLISDSSLNNNLIDLTIFPNPVQDYFMLNIKQFDYDQSYNFILINILGNKIFQKFVHKGEIKINIENEIENGVYYYKVCNNEKIVHRGKLVICR